MSPTLKRTAVALALAAVTILIAAYAWLPAPIPGPRPDEAESALPETWPKTWIAPPETARRLIAADALVFDARAPILRISQPLPGAVPVQWEQFSRRDAPYQGELLDDDDALTRSLQSLGVSGNRPVVVVADPIRGWGEDGRIVWMLHTLGHEHAYLVDGGVDALLADGPVRIPWIIGGGDFVVDRNERWLTTIDAVRDRLDTEDGVFVDVREPREFFGATPYGEERGGHLPGARQVYYRELLAADGRLLPQPQIRALLAGRGIADGTEVVAYCTGGVRAAWFTVVLHDLGYEVRNYAGSMWEWAAAEPDDHPLTTVVEPRPGT